MPDITAMIPEIKIPAYSFEQFERDIESMQPRPFDIYVLGPFMVWFAVASKKSMGRWPRRLLFTAGVYTIFRNWQAYRDFPQEIAKYRENFG